jgi:hypothetical protein
MKKLLLLFALAGCTAGVKPAQTASGGSSGPGVAGTTGSPGTGGGGNVITGAAGTTGAGGTGTSDASIADGAACASDEVMAQPVPLDLYVIMDSSKSMLEMTTAGSTKWKAVTDAMSAFFADTGSAGLGVALKFFPALQSAAPADCLVDGDCMMGGMDFGPCDRRKTCVGASTSTMQVLPLCVASECGTQSCSLVRECVAGSSYCAAGPSAPATACMGCTEFKGYCHLRDICTSNTYATPDIALTMLPSTTLGPMVAARNPGGYTPTGPALTGALAFARQRIASTPDHRIAVVLVTDGLPGGFLTGIPPAECTPGDVPGIRTLLSGPQGTAGAPPVLTFVIGVFAPGMSLDTARTNLDMLATAGGTAPAVVIDTSQNVTMALQTALKQVQSKAIACSYKIPPPKMGSIDFKKVNVAFKPSTAGATPTVIGKTTMAACDQRGGWYYDNEAAPTEIKACPATCQQLQTDVDGVVQIQLGCQTILID